MDDIYSKVLYGPTLPKNTKSHNQRSKRRSSSSSAGDESCKIIQHKYLLTHCLNFLLKLKFIATNRSRSPNHKNGSTFYKSLDSKDKLNRSFEIKNQKKPQQQQSHRKDPSDDEDLEEFLNKLKKNKSKK